MCKRNTGLRTVIYDSCWDPDPRKEQNMETRCGMAKVFSSTLIAGMLVVCTLQPEIAFSVTTQAAQEKVRNAYG